MFRFPWGDFHSLNLGWFLQKFKELLQDWETAKNGIVGALDAEIQKAEDALTDVFAARDAAAASASAANSSALNASQSSLASMNARDQSRAARDAAQQAATNAAGSESAAAGSATAAAGSATAAAGSATQAGQSATAAAGSATQAGQSATAAGNSATQAGNSARDAEDAAASVEASRQQIANNTNEIGDLKESFELEAYGTTKYKFNVGYIANNGSSINPADNHPTSTGFRYALIPCTEGDIFFVGAIGGTGAALTYSWINSSNEIIITGMGITRAALTAPTNAAYLLINNEVSKNPNYYAYKNYPILNNPNYLKFINGSVFNPNNENAVATPLIIPTNGAKYINLHINKALESETNHYRAQFSYFSVTEGAINPNNAITQYANFNFKEGFYDVTAEVASATRSYAVAIYELTASDDYVPIRIADIDDYFCEVSYGYGVDSDTLTDYTIDASYLKRTIKCNLLGSISCQQAFMIYNEKYYSVEENKLVIQNSTFSAETTLTPTIGHANSIQLGNSGKAYISGWNDNKVYVFDLSTNTVESIITLPTTGYTTAAVDDLNGIMYIFQRNTSPSTPTNYNFIAYDYINDNIISTKVIESFAAMQACDFYQGKILMCYGLGTTEAPSGMSMYDTNGNILSSYHVSPFDISPGEPEGVFMDRSGNGIYLSTADYKLYKIT